jgi:hypothetical protein
MGEKNHRRARSRCAAATALLAISALTLAACKEDADEVTTVGSETDSATPTGGAGSDAGDDGTDDAETGGTGGTGGTGEDVAPDDGEDGENSESEDDGSGGTSDFAVEAPGPFKGLSRADVLITATESLPDRLIERIQGVKGVETALAFSLGSASIDGRTLTVAAVDPGAFRQFTPDVTARADFVWERVAGGELAVDTDLDKRLVDKDDMMLLGSDADAPEVHVGAIAPLIKRSPGTPSEQPVIQVLMNEKRGEQLGVQEQNAILVDTGEFTPSALEKEFDRILGDQATQDTLAIEFDDFGQTAVLTGQSVTEAVGTFTYTNGPDGTIKPDQAWVDEFIRTEPVPILGNVTCNKGMLPQLRGAFTQIELEGLSDEIRPDEYAGCYYPRYIGRDPSNGLSLHSWGIAVDLNTPNNQMGTEGDMHPRVVEIFKLWGFAWGGDWSYTDPMHFEMSKVVRLADIG